MTGAIDPEKSPGGPSRAPRVSVVLATDNRLDLLKRLLARLAEQTLSPEAFEVVVVDDGSPSPVAPQIRTEDYPYALKIVAQANAGPAAARHRGVLHATGEILVLLDDDMDLPPRFLEAHLAYHASGRPTCVVGRYVSDPAIGSKPLFEKYHGYKWDKLTEQIADGSLAVDGTCLATGNASMRREDYLRAGGLDFSLERAEDLDLGVALEEAGVRLVYSDSAGSVHLSDHTEPRKWRKRAYQQGFYETRIARKHPTMVHANPWRHAFSLPTIGRALCLPSLLAPAVGGKLAGLAYDAAVVADKLGMERAAFRGAGLVYGMEYFRGMREEAGTFSRMVSSCGDFLARVSETRRTVPGLPLWLARTVDGLRRLTRSV